MINKKTKSKKNNANRKKNKKRGLVKGYIPPLPKEVLENSHFKKKMKDLLKGHEGIYVLYSDDNLYYVGITRDLFQRLNHHKHDTHKGNWNKFSVFVIGGGKYLKDIETIVNYISNPPGNIIKGRFQVDKKFNYNEKIKQMIIEIFDIVERINGLP